jgi:hypothetical protein
MRFVAQLTTGQLVANTLGALVPPAMPLDFLWVWLVAGWHSAAAQ